MLRCYDSKRQNQEGWSSLHGHFGCKRHRFTTLNHKRKNLQSCRVHDCAQTIFDSNKTAEGRLAKAVSVFPNLLCKQGAAGSSPATSTNYFFFNEVASMFSPLTTCYSGRGSRV